MFYVNLTNLLSAIKRKCHAGDGCYIYNNTGRVYSSDTSCMLMTL